MAYQKLNASRASVVSPSDTDLIPNISNPDTPRFSIFGFKSG